MTGGSDCRTLSALVNRTAPTETSPESVAELRVAITELKLEIRTLFRAMDEFRTDFSHCLRNLSDNLPPPYAHLGTMFEAFSNEPRSQKSDAFEVEPNPPAETPVAETASPSPALPTRVASVPDKTPSPPVAAVKRSARPKKSKQPLSVRMVFVPLMTAVVRIAGYERWETEEIKLRLRPLCERYGQESVELAAKELLSCDEALKHASQILGSRKSLVKVPDSDLTPEK